MPVVIAIIVVIIAYVILKKTALGLYIESVGINGTASRLVGLNSTMIKFLTYLICGNLQVLQDLWLPAVSTQQIPTTLV